MTTRRGSFRSSVFVVLALAAAHVPACEYGDGTTTMTPTVDARPLDGAPAVVEAPLDQPLSSQERSAPAAFPHA